MMDVRFKLGCERSESMQGRLDGMWVCRFKILKWGVGGGKWDRHQDIIQHKWTNTHTHTHTHMHLLEWLTFSFGLSVQVKKILFLSYIPHTREGPWILWDTAFFPSINKHKMVNFEKEEYQFTHYDCRPHIPKLQWFWFQMRLCLLVYLFC